MLYVNRNLIIGWVFDSIFVKMFLKKHDHETSVFIEIYLKVGVLVFRETVLNTVESRMYTYW